MGLCLCDGKAWGVSGFALGWERGLERGAVREWGELVSGEDSGLDGWGVRVCACACVTGRSAVSGLGGVGLFCGMMHPLAGMAQKSP